MSEELIIKHCSPTLAGLKTASLFSCYFTDANEMRDNIRHFNKTLRKKGLRMISLRYKDNRALIYVYRPHRLSRDLQHDTACKILQERGYTTQSTAKCVFHLIKRFCQYEEFPHEIGLFLGYPPEDVCGFIENKSEGCKHVGHWKVYGNVENAKKLFDKYKKCTDIYCTQFAKGKSIERLTVAG